LDLKVQILDKAFELFTKFGIKSVSMDDLSSELGISKKTLYQTICNKNELIEKIFTAQIEKEKEILEQTTSQSTDAIEELLMVAQRKIDILKKLSQSTIFDLKKYHRNTWNSIESLHQKYMLKVLIKNLKKGISQGLYRENINPEIVARIYLGQSLAIMDGRLFPKNFPNFNQVPLQAIECHLRGIVSEKGLAVFNQKMDKLLKN
jgi:AcrR family transcriptional regulator